jgi:hypothetical protein
MKLNRSYTQWESIGYLTANSDFSGSSQRFRSIFKSGYYYAKFDSSTDCWHFTQESSGNRRYPHYTVNYTGEDGGITEPNEHFTYAQGERIYASSLRTSSAASDFNERLDQIAIDYPSVLDYKV